MNFQDLWAGSDYAYTGNRSKGSFPMQCERVRIVRTFKRREFGNDRMSAYAIVERMTDDGERRQVLGGQIEDIRPKEFLQPIEVRVRDIVDHWEDWLGERNHRLDEQKRRQEEIDARQQRRQDRINAAMAKLVTVGLDADRFSSDDYNRILIPIEEIERWYDDESYV